MARGTEKHAVIVEPVAGPWGLPAGWRWGRLRTIGRWGSGGTPKAKTPEFYGGNIPWYKIGDLNDGTLSKPQEAITELGLNSSSAKLLPSETLLIAMYGSIGKLGITSRICATNQAIAFCIPDTSIVQLKYLFYYLRGRRDHLLSLGQGGTQQNISQTLLLEEPIPIPSVEVQDKIVEKIDELFTELADGEAALARAQADLSTWRKALLKAAVTGELTDDWRAANPPTETGADLLARILTERRTRWLDDPRNKGKRYVEPAQPSTSELPELPQGWAWASMEQLSWASGYGTSEKCIPDGRGTVVLRIPNIRGGRIDLGDLKRTATPLDLGRDQALQVGDLLIIRTNGSEDLIGRAALVVEPPAETTYFASYLIRLRLLGPPKLLNWLATLVDSPIFRSAVLRSIGSSAGQYNLNLTKIEGFALPIPPSSEIDVAITAFQSAAVDALDAEAFATAAEVDAATLRQSILAAGFRGELVV